MCSRPWPCPALTAVKLARPRAISGEVLRLRSFIFIGLILVTGRNRDTPRRSCKNSKKNSARTHQRETVSPKRASACEGNGFHSDPREPGGPVEGLRRSAELARIFRHVLAADPCDRRSSWSQRFRSSG